MLGWSAPSEAPAPPPPARNTQAQGTAPADSLAAAAAPAGSPQAGCSSTGSSAGPSEPHAEDDWDRRDWAAAYVTAPEEPEGYWMELEGALPPGLCGTYFRNGPGIFEVGDHALVHPFDGQGLVASIAVRGGRAFFRSRYVRTAEFERERAERRMLFRGTFGSAPLGGAAANALDLYPKNVANTNVLLWGGRCLALFEAGQPYGLDAVSLATRGLDLLGGRLRPGVPFDLGAAWPNQLLGSLLRHVGGGRHLAGGLALGGDALTAHPRVDPATGRLVFFSYRLRLGALALSLVTELTFWEFDEDFALVASRQYDLPGYAFLHDFAVTHNFYIAFQNPVALDLAPFLLGRAAPAHCVRWCGEGGAGAACATRVHLIPRAQPAAAAARGALSPAAAAAAKAQPPGSDAAHAAIRAKPQCAQLGTHPLEQRDLNSAGTDTSRPLSREAFSLLPEKLGAQLKAAGSGLGSGSFRLPAFWGLPGHAPEAAAADAAAAAQLAPTSSSRASLPRPKPTAFAAFPPSCAPPSCTPPAAGAAAAAAQRGPARADALIAVAAPAFVFHHANAYEEAGPDGRARLVVDCVRYPRMPDFAQASSGGRSFVKDVDPALQPISQLWRYVVDLAGARVEAERPLAQRAMEFPVVNPAFAGRRHRYVYAAAARHASANRPQQALAKIDTATGAVTLWSRGRRYYVGEPQFIPRQRAAAGRTGGGDGGRQRGGAAASTPAGMPPASEAVGARDSPAGALPSGGGRIGSAANGAPEAAEEQQGEEEQGEEDDGWLLALCWDAGAARSELVLLDARDVAAGPVAVLPLRQPLPHGLHGNWAAEYCGPAE